MDINALFEDINQKFNIRNINRLTQFFIMTAAVVSADMSWSWLNKAFLGQKSWLWVGAGLFLFLSLLSLNWLMFKKSNIILGVGFLIILITFLSIFGWRIEYVIMTIIAFVCFMLGSFQAIKEKDGRINIKCSKIFRMGLPLMITGIALLLAAAFYFSPLATKKTEIEVPRPLFDIVIKPILIQTGQESAANLSEGETATLEIDPKLLEKFGLLSTEGQDLEDVLYQLVNKQINQFIQPFQEYFPLGLTIGFFFLVKAIGFVAMYLVIFFSWLIFRILVSTGAIKINVEPAVREIIEI